MFFTDSNNDEPIISTMSRELDMNVGIDWGKLEDFRHNVYGSLVINIEEKDKDRVCQFLDEKEVGWEVL